MYLTIQDVTNFNQYLQEQERAQETIQKYMREIQKFYETFKDREITKENVIEYKAQMVKDGLAPSTVNTKLSALNSLFRFLNHPELFLKFLKIQQKVFLAENKELTKKDYETLVKTAYNIGKEQLALIIQTICATGIRVSELKYITKEAVLHNNTMISLKGKERTILISKELKKKLMDYIKRNNIEGVVFQTKNGTPISRHQIWRQMKDLCEEAKIDGTKVFPHNLRHLFAVVFYDLTNDIVELSNILGHSSINTTRLYLTTSFNKYLGLMNKMKLVC